MTDHDDEYLRRGLKVCGECDGRKFLTGRRRRVCPACLGTGRYTYNSAGHRLALGRHGWRRT